MNILIIKFGVEKYYLKYLIKNNKVNKIFIINDIKLPQNKIFTQIEFDINEIKIKNQTCTICTESSL